MAPPNRGPMVSSPLTRQLTRSLPALAVTIVLCAPAEGPLVFQRIYSSEMLGSFSVLCTDLAAS